MMKSNAFKNLYATFIFFFCQWLSTILIFRIAGAQITGEYTIAYSFANIFEPICFFGLRSIVLTQKKFTQKDFLTANLTFMLLGLVVCFVSILFTDFTLHIAVCCVLVMLFKMFLAFTDFLYAEMQLENKFTIIAISATLRGILPVTAMCIGLLFSLKTALAAMLITYVLCCLFYDLRTLSLPFRLDFKKIFQIAVLCFPLIISAFISPIVNFYVRNSIKNSYSEEILGYFTSVYSLNLIMPLLAGAIWQLFLPQFTAEYENKQFKKMRKKVLFMFFICLSITLAAVLICMFFGDFLLKLVFGKAILGYNYLLIPTIIVSGISLIGGLFSTVLAAKKKYRLIGISGVILLVVCLAFTTSFIEKFGIIGGIYVVIFGGIIQIVFCILSGSEFFVGRGKTVSD